MSWIIITAVFVSFLPEEFESHYFLLCFKAPASWWVCSINWKVVGGGGCTKSWLLCTVHCGFDSHFLRLRKVLRQLLTQLPYGRIYLKYFKISASYLSSPSPVLSSILLSFLPFLPCFLLPSPLLIYYLSLYLAIIYLSTISLYLSLPLFSPNLFSFY